MKNFSNLAETTSIILALPQMTNVLVGFCLSRVCTKISTTMDIILDCIHSNEATITEIVMSSRKRKSRQVGGETTRDAIMIST